MRLVRRTLICLLIGVTTFGVICWRRHLGRPLTAEHATEALANWVRSEDGMQFIAIKDAVTDLARKEATSVGQIFEWGPFAIDLHQKEYTFALVYGPPQRTCTWKYLGTFEWRESGWMANAPRVVSQALGSAATP
jgi:hypothetical protein